MQRSKKIVPPEDPFSFEAQEKRSLIKEWERFKEYNKYLIYNISNLYSFLLIKSSIRAEEYHRCRFDKQQVAKDSIVLPETVRKFISTIKYSVRNSMRSGGTPFSILRSLFIYWDRERSGKVNDKDLFNCMQSLGVRSIQIEDIRDVISYYNRRAGKADSGQLEYGDLLNDVQAGEPSMLQFSLESNEELEKANKDRYSFVKEDYSVQPPLVKMFLQAVRHSIMRKIMRDGGTPASLVRQVFMQYDLNYSPKLNSKEFIQAMRKGLGIVLSENHAKEVLRFYNRDSKGGGYGNQILVQNIVSDFPSILDFSASSGFVSEDWSKNPFVKPEFHLSDNQTIEAFKQRIMSTLGKQIASQGGSYKALMREAFRFWDEKCIGKLQDTHHVIGAFKRIKIEVTADELRLVMQRYDSDNDGQLNYILLINDLAGEEIPFLSDVNRDIISKHKGGVESPTRCPANVKYCSESFKAKADAYALKTGGKLIPRDILHGTFARFDPMTSGRIDLSSLKKVCGLLHIQISDAKLMVLASWFDTNGSYMMDYNAFLSHIYASSELQVKTSLPKSKQLSSPSDFSQAFVESPLNKKNSVQRRLMRLKEEEDKKAARIALIKAEKLNIKSKLASVETQKKMLEEMQQLKA